MSTVNHRVFLLDTILSLIPIELQVIIENRLIDCTVDIWFNKEEIRYLIDNHRYFSVTYESEGECEFKQYTKFGEDILLIKIIGSNARDQYESSKSYAENALFNYMNGRTFFSDYVRRNDITNMWFDLESIYVVFKMRLDKLEISNADKIAKDKVKMFILTTVWTTKSKRTLQFSLRIDGLVSPAINYTDVNIEEVKALIDLF